MSHFKAEGIQLPKVTGVECFVYHSALSPEVPREFVLLVALVLACPLSSLNYTAEAEDEGARAFY